MLRYSRIFIIVYLAVLELQKASPCISLVVTRTDFPGDDDDDGQNDLKKIGTLLINQVQEGVKVTTEYSGYFYKVITDCIFKGVCQSQKLFPRSMMNRDEQKQDIPFSIFPSSSIYASILLSATNFAFLARSGYSLYMRRFSSFNIGSFIISCVVPVFTIPYENNLSATVISTSYLERIWRFLTLQKEEKKILPPSEEHLFDKMHKLFFPGISMKDSPINFKEIMKNIIETIEFFYSNFLTACIFSAVTSLICHLMYNFCQSDTEQKRTFTDEELIEDYKDNEEFYQELKEWLTTPRKSREYKEENGDEQQERNESGQNYYSFLAKPIGPVITSCSMEDESLKAREGKKIYTDEELLEDYKEDEEFYKEFKAWLNPHRNRNCKVENDDLTENFKILRDV